MYTCQHCGDAFLFQPDSCPTCAQQHRRRATSKRIREQRASYDLSGSISDANFWQLLKWYPWCPCCGRRWEQIPESISRDHIIPISRGGVNTSANLQPLCHTCNSWKSDHLIAFHPKLAGHVVALPTVLHPLFKSVSPFQPPPIQDQIQINLFEHDSTPVQIAYPQATQAQLEAETIRLTWIEIVQSA